MRKMWWVVLVLFFILIYRGSILPSDIPSQSVHAQWQTPVPPTDTPVPTAYIRIRAANPQLTRTPVSPNTLCKVNCNVSPCVIPANGCNTTTTDQVDIAGAAANRGGLFNDSSYVVLGVTPKLNGTNNSTNTVEDPACKSANPPIGYCDYWTTALSTGYRTAMFIIATPTVVPTNTPTPTLYPTSALSGSLNQQGGAGSCTSYTSGPAPTVALSPDAAYTSWVTTSCSSNVPAGTYQCTINYDNQANSSLPSTINETLSSNANGLAGNWQNNACGGGATNTLAVAVGQVVSQNIYFGLSPWVKLVNGSLNTPGLTFSLIPANPVKFLVDTASDPGNAYLLDQASTNHVSLAINAPSTWAIPTSPTSQVSQPNWQATSYSPSDPFLGNSSFYQYIKARKQFTALSSSPSDLSGLTDGIYYYNGAVTLTKAPTNNVVLVVDGNVTISSNLAPTKGFALMVNGSMTLGNAVTKLTGLYVASSFATGTASSLEVIGNLVSAAAISNNLVPTNNLAPSMLVVFDPTQYVDLLPYLSVSKYNWQLLQ